MKIERREGGEGTKRRSRAWKRYLMLAHVLARIEASGNNTPVCTNDKDPQPPNTNCPRPTPQPPLITSSTQSAPMVRASPQISLLFQEFVYGRGLSDNAIASTCPTHQAPRGELKKGRRPEKI